MDIYFVLVALVLGNNANVGIGAGSPEVKLQIEGGTDAGHSGGGFVVLGSTGSSNIIMDNNEIMARNNSLASTLYLNKNGGNVIINGSGSDNVGIGTLSPSEKLDVVENIITTGAITASSDIQYKKGFESFTHTLDKLNEIKGQYYYWNQEAFPDKDFTDERQIGVMAQEVEAVFPEIVLTDKEGYKSVDYSRLTPILLEAIKEQQAMIKELRSENDAMTAEVAKMKNVNTSIQDDIAMLKAALNITTHE